MLLGTLQMAISHVSCPLEIKGSTHEVQPKKVISPLVAVTHFSYCMLQRGTDVYTEIWLFPFSSTADSLFILLAPACCTLAPDL